MDIREDYKLVNDALKHTITLVLEISNTHPEIQETKMFQEWDSHMTEYENKCEIRREGWMKIAEPDSEVRDGE